MLYTHDRRDIIEKQLEFRIQSVGIIDILFIKAQAYALLITADMLLVFLNETFEILK